MSGELVDRVEKLRAGLAQSERESADAGATTGYHGSMPMTYPAPAIEAADDEDE
jgi:hypothetical protein